MTNTKINKQRVRHDFSQAASSYDDAAVIQHEICDRTLERIDMLNLQPARVLDIGTGTGRSFHGLQSRFPNALIIACDLALPMLKQCQQLVNSEQAGLLVCNDAEQLPFADATIDLIFSTSTFQWCTDLHQLFSECMRVLCPNGALIFSTFGPDTLVQLRNSWAEVDDREHVHEFIDMHHIGDLLLTTRFLDPVVDMEMIDIQYQSLLELLRDLKDTGSRGKFAHSASARPQGLMSKEKYKCLQLAYEKYRQKNDLLPASYEVVYGYARKPAHDFHESNGIEVRVPMSDIKK